MRRPLDGLALVCGAIAPDLPYYIRATPIPVTAESWYEPFTNATTSHSVSGVPLVSLPLAAVLYLLLLAAYQPMQWLTHSEWGGGLIDSIRPQPTQPAPEANRNIASWAWVPVALLIGIVTHLLWDSLTSSDGLLAERRDVLNNTVIADLSWVDLIAHISSLAGLAIISAVLWRHRHNIVSSDPTIRRRTWWVFGGVAAVALILGVTIALFTVESADAISRWNLIEHYATTAAVVVGAVVVVTIGLGTLCWWIVWWVNKKARDGVSARASVDM